MTSSNDTNRTAVLLVDPNNDFLSEGGKLWSRVQPVADDVGLLNNLKAVLEAARKRGLAVYFVPHRRWQEGDYAGTWGGEFRDGFQPQPGEVVVKEHWAQSGFANTDLDFQLKQRGINRVILIGVLANTCVESTGRFAMELGYHVTLVRDATAAFSPEMMHRFNCRPKMECASLPPHPVRGVVPLRVSRAA